MSKITSGVIGTAERFHGLLSQKNLGLLLCAIGSIFQIFDLMGYTSSLKLCTGTVRRRQKDQ